MSEKILKQINWFYFSPSPAPSEDIILYISHCLTIRIHLVFLLLKWVQALFTGMELLTSLKPINIYSSHYKRTQDKTHSCLSIS